MRIPRSCRLAAWGLAAPLLMLGSAVAQDGKQPVGPPTTTPATNKLREKVDTFDPPTVGSEVLTPVPATATDPAPPGTRAERVDLNNGARRPAMARRGPNLPADLPGVDRAAPLPEGSQVAEGLIDGKMKTPGKDLPNEQIRFTLNPSRNWADYTAKSAAPSASAKDEAKPIDVVVTRKTHIYTYSRTPDGKIVPDASNPFAPASEAARTAPNVRVPHYAVTNFTNLKPEQYVAVQYRTDGDLHVATSVAIIVRASDTAVADSLKAAPAPAGAQPSVRVPRIPATPAEPSIGN